MLADFKIMADSGAAPEELAEAFLNDYFGNRPITFPINPFSMLRDMGVIFSFRPFSGYEGIYIPADGSDDIAAIGINLERPITRQRYTAAHELCHHIKDRGMQPTLCPIDASTAIERYAEAFAAELLMPRKELVRQVELHGCKGRVDFDGVLRIANYFGVSFEACLYQLAYDLHAISGDTSSQSLKQRREQYKPNGKRKTFGFNDTVLFEQLFDTAGDLLHIDATPRVRQRFEAEYIFHDARMEDVRIEKGTAAEIVVDLRLKRQASEYCNSENRNIIEVAGLTLAYDYVFDKASSDEDINIYDTKSINEALFSATMFPQYAGGYRQANPVVVGGGFETVDYQSVSYEMMMLGKSFESLLSKKKKAAYSQVIEQIVDLHHRLTLVHPFRDGNGRTSRAFANLLFLRYGLPPTLFDITVKDKYRSALAEADATGCLDMLYELYFKQMLKSFSILTDNAL